MKRFFNEIKYWGQVLLLPMYGLSFLFPRKKKIWIFGSTFGSRFADNPRYLYTYLQNKNKIIRPIWITRNKGIYKALKNCNAEVYMTDSLKGYWFALRGGVYIYDNYTKDINFWLSGNALHVNTWHGIPLKKIQMDNKFDLVRHPKNKWARFKWSLRRLSDEKPSDFVITTSEFLKDIFFSAFATNNVIINNYPRVDMLNGHLKNTILLEEEKTIQKSMLENRKFNKKNIIYMPTFRESEVKFFDVVNIQKFLDFLEENNMFFYVKLHPKSKNYNKFKSIQHSSLLVIDKDSDPYTYLGLTDMLMTDYSSIYFDYLVTNKPIVFFSYDLETYLNESRELYFPYEEFTPGNHITTMEELMKTISDVLIGGIDEFSDDRAEIKEKVFEDASSFGCEGVIKDIEKLLK